MNEIQILDGHLLCSSQVAEVLYTRNEDRQKTMLAYEAQYFPYWQLGKQHQIAWQDTRFLEKQAFLNRCNHDLTEVNQLPIDRRFPEKSFVIRWVYGAIPTQIEWEKVPSRASIIVDYRISPLISDGGGRVCLLSLHDQDYYSGRGQ